MREISINWMALNVAVIAKMVLGALWYSPLLFVKQWMALAGVTEAQMKVRLPRALISDLIGTIIMAFVLLYAVRYAGAVGFVPGAAIGIVNWLGFVAVTSFTAVVYEHRPLQLWLINNGFQLAGLTIMGALLGGWQ
jgi:hypothetical protein